MIYIKLRNLLNNGSFNGKRINLDENLKKDILKVFGNNLDDIYFQPINIGRKVNGTPFWFKDFHGNMVNLSIDECKGCPLNKKEKIYKSKCCICGKKHNDKKEIEEIKELYKKAKTKEEKMRFKDYSGKYANCDKCLS